MIGQGRISGSLCQNCFNPDAHTLGKFKLKWPLITRSAWSGPDNPTEKQETLDSLDITRLPDYLTKTPGSAKIEPQQHYTQSMKSMWQHLSHCQWVDQVAAPLLHSLQIECTHMYVCLMKNAKLVINWAMHINSHLIKRNSHKLILYPRLLIKVNFLILSSITTVYTTVGQSGSLLKCDSVNTCCFFKEKGHLL